MNFDSIRLRVRLWGWALRRQFMCPRGAHVWTHFGRRSRVCRCCHREEWLGPDGWKEETGRFAETRPSEHQ